MDKINPALFLLVIFVVALMAVGTILFQRMASARGAELYEWKDNATACTTSLLNITQELNAALDTMTRSKEDVRKYDVLYTDVTAQLGNLTLLLNDTRRMLENEKLWRQRAQQEAAALQAANNQLNNQLLATQQSLKEANAATMRCQNSLRACREATP